MHLAYLALLGGALVFYTVIAGRRRLGEMTRQALLWVMIFVGVIALAGLWPGLRGTLLPQQSIVGGVVEVPQGPGGHYRLTLGLNGTPVDFIVDTGASDIVLSRDDAERIGFDPDRLSYLGRAETANGSVPLAMVMLDEVRLGEMVDTNVRASVNGSPMNGSLLGMSYLSRFGRIQIENGRLTLER
ncbi:aspartyl protease family protein [Profundibacterium mesophilum KAUST100406-0324]|uniref:Aspartyl protease family protein n=2 Tax=Profundibacterium TaxID=1258570 RepID=A0A921NSZ2_9RHOB|nr:aspartyl protease family protein [Profundibacterium mesophilum KAUST100406-0324]